MVKRKAQSILEYVIVLSAIVAAVIAAARGPITNAVNNMFNDASTTITEKSSQFHSNVGTTTANK
ncbi:MAG: hypothetical protein WC412_07680 [Candidatus Omnitrophota bacterium]